MEPGRSPASALAPRTTSPRSRTDWRPGFPRAARNRPRWPRIDRAESQGWTRCQKRFLVPWSCWQALAANHVFPIPATPDTMNIRGPSSRVVALSSSRRPTNVSIVGASDSISTNEEGADGTRDGRSTTPAIRTERKIASRLAPLPTVLSASPTLVSRIPAGSWTRTVSASARSRTRIASMRPVVVNS